MWCSRMTHFRWLEWNYLVHSLSGSLVFLVTVCVCLSSIRLRAVQLFQCLSFSFLPLDLMILLFTSHSLLCVQCMSHPPRLDPVSWSSIHNRLFSIRYPESSRIHHRIWKLNETMNHNVVFNYYLFVTGACDFAMRRQMHNAWGGCGSERVVH